MSDQVPASYFLVTAEDIRAYPWQDILNSSPEKHTWNYVDLLAKAAKECVGKSDDRGKRVYGLLQTLAEFNPNFDLKANPFQPMWVNSNGQRSLMAEDLVEIDLKALKDILPEIADPTFRARAGDVLWECSKDHTAARAAVAAYVEQAKNDPDEAFGTARHGALERAAQLSAKLGYGQELHKDTIAVIEQWAGQVAAAIPAQNRMATRQFMMILLLYSDVAPTKYAAISEDLAKQCSGLNDYEAGHGYWDMAAQWWRKTKKPYEVERCEREGAECLILAAEEIIKVGKLGFGGAARTMEERTAATPPGSRSPRPYRRGDETLPGNPGKIPVRRKQAFAELGGRPWLKRIDR